MENEASSTQLVSIGLPVYNGEEFLAEALDSLLAQTYTHFELIISDNASTDKTEAICRKYAKKDKRIRYIRQAKNIGPYKNFNLLLKEVKGEYFMWAADDDVRDKVFIQRCIAEFDKHPNTIMVFSNLVNINEFGETVRKYQISKMFPNHNPLSYVKLYCSDGKANLIYGLWRYDIIASAKMQNHWGSDMNLVFDQRLKGEFYAINQVLFYKRLVEQDMDQHSTKPYKLPLRKLRYYKRLSTEAKPYFAHIIQSIHKHKGILWGRTRVGGLIVLAHIRLLLREKI